MAQRLEVTYISGYTEGSAARELKPVQPFKKLRLPKFRKKKRRVICMDPVAIGAIALSAVLLVAMLAGMAEFLKLRDEAQIMEQYVQTLQEKNEELEAAYKAGYNLDDVRKNVTALGYVPLEQVERIAMEIPEIIPQQRLSVWERVYTFLVNLLHNGDPD